MDVRVPADAGWGSIAFGTSGMIVSVAAGAVTSLPERTPAAANCLVITGLLPHRNISSGAGRTQGNYGACTRPAPTSVAGSGRCRAVAVSLARNARPRNDGLVWAHRAAHPATCGVAMLVPLMVLCKVGRGHDEKIFTPGPAMSTFPPHEKTATRSALSSAPTD